MTARSLRPLLEGKTRSHRDFIRSGLGGWRLVSDGRYKLIRGFDPSERGAIAAHTQQEMKGAPPLLFDLESDPLENRNIAAQAPEVVARLSELLPRPTPIQNAASAPEKARKGSCPRWRMGIRSLSAMADRIASFEQGPILAATKLSTISETPLCCLSSER